MTTRLAAKPEDAKACGQVVADAWRNARTVQLPFEYRSHPCFVGADVQGYDFSHLLLGFDDDPETNGRSSDSWWVFAANFSDVNAANANFDHTDLYGAWFVNTTLDGVTFRGADIRSVNLTGASGLDPALLEGALCDLYTIWPQGFDFLAVPGLREVPGSSSAWLRAKERDPKLAELMGKSIRAFALISSKI